MIDQEFKGKKPMNACVHTYTKPQTSSTRSRGPGWRIHGRVEDTKLSTNKQHTLSLTPFVGWRTSARHADVGLGRVCARCLNWSIRVQETRVVLMN